jgi:predicted HicB family RNase H-like nuclease
MSSIMDYKGYRGRAELDQEAGIIHGEVLDTRDVITFEAKSVEELREAFRESVDDYLDFCAERGEDPDKPFSGRLMVRIPPDLHRRLYVQAKRQGKSLNQFISERLERAS